MPVSASIPLQSMSARAAAARGYSAAEVWSRCRSSSSRYDRIAVQPRAHAPAELDPSELRQPDRTLGTAMVVVVVVVVVGARGFEPPTT